MTETDAPTTSQEPTMPKDGTQASPGTTKVKHPREVLDQARMAQFIRAAKTDDAKALVRALREATIAHEAIASPRQRARKVNDLRTFERAVGAFLSDLIYHAANTDACGFTYRPQDKEALSDTLVSYTQFTQLLTYWKEMGLIELTGFIRVRETWEGDEIGVSFARAARMRATAELLGIAGNHGITPGNVKDHFERQEGLIRPVTIRTEATKNKGKSLPSRNMRISGPALDSEVARVKEVNSYLGNGGFDLEDTPQVYRLFNRGNHPGFDFNMGGRLYCASEDNWQLKSPEVRGKITRLGGPTVEIDVRASYLHILYAMHGLELPIEGDPYGIPGIEREVVKGLMVAIFGNGGGLKRWPVKMAETYLKTSGVKLSQRYTLAKVNAAIFERHPILEKVKVAKLDWAHLQYEESECFLSAMLELGRDYHVSALPVFDSLIVAEGNQELAKDILGQAYQRRLGSRPIIRAK
jgi:hypothetical protein